MMKYVLFITAVIIVTVVALFIANTRLYLKADNVHVLQENDVCEVCNVYMNSHSLLFFVQNPCSTAAPLLINLTTQQVFLINPIQKPFFNSLLLVSKSQLQGVDLKDRVKVNTGNYHWNDNHLLLEHPQNGLSYLLDFGNE